MHITVVSTVLNEGAAIRRLMDSLVAQTRTPDEVVIVDGGSSDDTVAELEEYRERLPLRVIVEPGANISRGRNFAIRAAQGEIIACTDAGVWLDPDWLEVLVAPLERTGDGLRQAAVAGFFVPDSKTTFEQAMGATVLPGASEIDPGNFLPSSRSVAFTRAAWEAAGGYPEWLDYCEDVVFDLQLRRTAGAFAWAPSALAHFRPRGSLRSFFRQYYRYARGDGKANLWPRRHAVRYGTYLIALPTLLGLILSPGRGLARIAALLMLLAGGAAYCRTPYRRLQRVLPCHAPGEQLRLVLLVPVIRVTGDMAKMIGYPVGWLWRLRNWGRSAIHWQTPPAH